MERLEQVKKTFGDKYIHSDIKWLIEQAERVDYLEKVYKFEANQHEKFKKIALDMSVELEAEIKILREALTFYADSDNYEVAEEERDYYNSNIEDDKGRKAKSALEETK